LGKASNPAPAYAFSKLSRHFGIWQYSLEGYRLLAVRKSKVTSMKILKLLLAGLWLACAASAHAGFEEGEAAYKKDDYAAAMKEWLPLAEQGEARSVSTWTPIRQLP
jgi:hypothetical protein